MVTSELGYQLRGERLTIAEVLYYMPDHPALLQRFLWQALDLSPDYPRVHRFLDYWRAEIDAVIHSVTVSTAGLVAPARLVVARDIAHLN